MGKNACLGLAVTLIVFFLSGCANNNYDDNNKNGPRAHSYSNDGYLGLTNTYPNLPTNPGYHTYDVDAQSIRRAAMKIKGVSAVNVAFVGGEANVRLRLDKGIGSGEAKRIQQEALKQITYEMPRYPVTVTVD